MEGLAGFLADDSAGPLLSPGVYNLSDAEYCPAQLFLGKCAEAAETVCGAGQLPAALFCENRFSDRIEKHGLLYYDGGSDTSHAGSSFCPLDEGGPEDQRGIAGADLHTASDCIHFLRLHLDLALQQKCLWLIQYGTRLVSHPLFGIVLVAFMIPEQITYISVYLMFSVIGIWNSYFWPLVMTNSDKFRPLTLYVEKLKQDAEQGLQWNLIMAGNLILVVPILIIYCFGSKQIIKAFTYNGIK